MITVVSGLPRSGTSLMMQILEKAGLTILSDGIRMPDDNNPKGYYEYEKVKSLLKDNSWLGEADGKVIKVIAQLIPFLVPDYDYKVIFMERDLDEILTSQNKMITSTGGNKSIVSNEILKNTFSKQQDDVKEYLTENNNFNCVYINYNKLVSMDDSVVKELKEFFNDSIDVDDALSVIDPELYRNRVTS